jgi:hypothetical protein
MLAATLLVAAVGGWAFYIRATTGDYPPLVDKLASKGQQVFNSYTGKLSKYSSQVQHAADEHSVPAASPQNATTADTPATLSQAPTTPAATGPAPAATLQPVAAVSNDHPSSENAPDSASSPTGISQKTVDASQTASPQPVEPSDNNQPAADNATAHDSPSPPDASREDDKQSAVQPKPPNRKRAPEPPPMVDGFSRQDVPDLLRQADSYAARGQYRLARYEYGLVLKLDRNNVQAREGLRRLLATWQSR